MSSLADYLPPSGETLTPDEILDRLMSWIAERGVELYEAQEEALFEIVGGKHVILNTPTGSGKSLVAVVMHFHATCLGERSFYTSPIKALVSEKFFALCHEFGAERVGMLTGDASINPQAPIICCTAEVLANMALRRGSDSGASFVIMDEFHYYSDRDRGWAWQVPLLTLPRATFLLMSATLGDTRPIEKKIVEHTGREVALVQSTVRPVPLEFTYVETALQETIATLNRKGQTPTYVVNFTQSECAELAQALTSLNLPSREEKEALQAAIGHFRFDTPYGKDVRRFVTMGIGIHHAGLLPRYRLLVEKLAQQGLLKVIVGTDTLGVGINVPIRSVLFSRLYKFDGAKTGILSVRDFKQIAGRAGRKGFDDVGYVYCQAPEHVVENLKLEQKAKAGKKVVKKRPPDRYAHYDAETFDRLATGRAEELEPRFEVNHAILMQLLQRDTADSPHGTGYRTLVRLIRSAYDQPREQRRLLVHAKQLFASLLNAGIVEVTRREGGPGSLAAVNDDLQRDFSLHQTLSLYLVETLELLNQNEEEYPLHVLSLVESILENPGVVLMRQADKARGELVAQMKADGADYEERRNAVEEVSWPRPLAEFLYQTFNEFSERHPWVGSANVRPKAVARDLVERYMTFNEYVKEFGLMRSEGVLLRYLSQAYRTAVQNVPEGYRTDGYMDVLGWLRAVLGRADSSLVTEWEQLRTGAGEELAGEAPLPERPLWADERALQARLRAEVHAFVKALAAQDYEDAAFNLRLDEDGDGTTPEQLAELMAPFFEEYGTLRFDHEARSPRLTRVERAGPRLWRVRQTLLDPEGDLFWYAEFEVDLSAIEASEEGLLRLVALTR